MVIFIGLRRDIVFLPNNIIWKEDIAAKVDADIAHMDMTPRPIRNSRC